MKNFAILYFLHWTAVPENVSSFLSHPVLDLLHSCHSKLEALVLVCIILYIHKIFMCAMGNISNFTLNLT